MQSNSQYKQDEFVIKTLNGKRDGFFLEIGSTDGVHINNTYILEKEYNWSGICIEPNKAVFNDLKSNRNCTCLCEVIDDKEHTVLFKTNSDWSQITHDTSANNTEQRHTSTINNILKTHNAPSVIDYLSIDCEGNELSILESIDFNTYNIHIITVEHNAFFSGDEYKNKIRNFLESKGYIFIKTNSKNNKHPDWVENIDDFYIHKTLFETNDSVLVPNSIIFYLVNNDPVHLRRLYSSLECLKKNFLNKYAYPVVLGHEGIDQNVMDKITQLLDGNCHFYNVNFKLPDYSADITNKIPERFKGHWDEFAFFSLGYRHMCRFFAGDIFNHIFFNNVKYLLRLDCDSYFTDTIPTDFFKQMVINNYTYGFISEQVDMDYVIEGLSDFCKTYFNSLDIYNDNIKYNGMYETNFEILNFQWFKNSEYKNFYNKIEQTGNIYIKRWGDAPIKYQGIKYLVPNSAIYKVSIPYKHGGDI